MNNLNDYKTKWDSLRKPKIVEPTDLEKVTNNGWALELVNENMFS